MISLRGALGAAVVVALGLASHGARAELLVEGGPTLTAGWTSNASNSSSATGDEYGAVSASGRLHYLGLRTEQSLGYRFSLTRYVHSATLNGFSQEVSYGSSYTLTDKWTATLGVSGADAHTTMVSPVAIAIVMPEITAQAIGDRRYRTGTATQGIGYSPTIKQHYTESFTATRLYYYWQDPNIVPMPDSTTFSGTLRGAWDAGRDVWSLELTASDTNTDPVAGPFGRLAGHRQYGQVLPGWRRQLTAQWDLTIAAGAVYVRDVAHNSALLPAGSATLDYRKFTWFATFLISQQAQTNAFIGNTTLNDQALARLVFPLEVKERLVLASYAGYTYARTPDGAARAFDIFSTGATLTARLPRTPLWAVLDYSFSAQRGGGGGLVPIPDRTRQVVFVSIGGNFSVGTESPPLARDNFYEGGPGAR
jgi:hypothetical protein